MTTDNIVGISYSDWRQSTIEFIQQYEGLHLTSYWDSKQYSIGYGTKSYKGEVITKEEADKRMVTHLNVLYELVDRPEYTNNQKIALVSYMYNTGGYQMNFNRYIKLCSHRDIRYIMGVYGYSSNGKRLQGLVNRRNAELQLFNK